MKLSEYVKTYNSKQGVTSYDTLINIFEYTDFLTQELNLGMFVPAKLVDGKWEVFKEPKEKDYKNKPLYNMDMHRYKKAKENLIFKNRDISDNDIFYHGLLMGKKIEDIINKVELTDEVKKRFKIC